MSMIFGSDDKRQYFIKDRSRAGSLGKISNLIFPFTLRKALVSDPLRLSIKTSGIILSLVFVIDLSIKEITID